MKCTSDQYMREQLPALGALAGALSTAYVLQRGQEGPYWHPLDRLGASMTVGYLAGLLAAPMIWKPCTPHEKALEEDRSMYGETYAAGSSWWSKVFNETPPEGCSGFSGHCPSDDVYNTIDGSRCPMSPSDRRLAMMATISCPEHETPIRKGPRPVEEPSPPEEELVSRSTPVRPRTFAQEMERVPTWVWIAGALGLGLYLGRK